MPTVAPSVKIPAPSHGVRPDLHPSEVPPEALRDAENWLRWRGAFRTRPGYTRLGSTIGQRDLGLVQYAYHDGTTRLVRGTTAGWWKFDSVTEDWIDITDPATPLTGAPTHQVVFRTFSKAGATWLLGVNGKDAPKKWDGAAATYLAMGGAPPIARAMMTLGDRILLGNLASGGTVSPVAVDVSALQDFDNGWGTVQTTILATTPGEIVAMQEMGSLMGAILKSDAIELAIAQDGTEPFRFEFKQRVPGPVSSNAVAQIAEGGPIAYLATDAAVRVFDGSSAHSLGPHIQRQIANAWNPTSGGRAWVAWHSDEQLLIVVFVPAGGVNPSRGVAISWPGYQCYPLRWASLSPTAGLAVLVPSGLIIGDLTGPIGDIEMTLGEMDSTVKRFMLGTSVGSAEIDDGNDDDGAAIPARFETGLSDLGDRRSWKTVTEMEHFFEPTLGPQPVNVRVGVSDYGEPRVFAEEAGGYGVNPYGEMPYGSENALDLQTGGPWRTGHRLTTRYLSLYMDAEVREPIIWLGSEPSVLTRGRR